MIYLYGGEFNGFLTCIYNHYYFENAMGIFRENIYKVGLFESNIYIETDELKAQKVYNAISNKFSKQLNKDIYTAFLSNDYYKDCYLLKYIILAFKYGNKIEKLYGNEDVYNVEKMSRNVFGEMHRFLGLLRFSDFGNCLYAKFEPDNDILILLGDHFADRLKEEKFIIHDLKRQKAIISCLGNWLITDFTYEPELIYDEMERLIQELWTGYFNTIGIKSRHNNKLQKAFVPMKYRKNIIEFNE